ncbi:MAG: SDR family oxidoreductase [Planctomycetota bacterium]|nr:SDR family oxidoreductase [Planctomycetaceae bacterium]MDQ3332668.1 SDR family oxidoreductase [Planctomycetota bacterium]
MSLAGKSVVVTGGGSGIGAAIATSFAADGANVIIAGRNAGKLQEVAAKAEGGRITTMACDVSEREQAVKLIEAATAKLGKVDILVNAAGVNMPKRMMHDLDPADWDRLMNINASGTFNTIHAVLPQMRQRKDGVIINVNSTSGVRAGMLGGVAYNASKFAVTALTHSVAQEVKDEGIRLTNLCPGEVDTPILEHRPTPVSSEHRSKILQPEDIAAVALTIANLPPRANVVEVVLKPTIQAFV